MLSPILIAAVLVGAAPPAHIENLHEGFDGLLARYVTSEGVRYAAWAANVDDRHGLDEYLTRLQGVQASSLERSDALAYWIDLYNAATLDLVLDHYPLTSIRDLTDDEGTPWQKPVVTVEGQALSLHQIENGILRPTFEDARIHFALNCAARGCPPLRPFAFTGDAIDEQLEQVTLDVIRDPRYVHVECRDGEGGIYLSRIFEWYAEDFEKSADSVHYFLADRRDDRLVILRERCALIYTDYDWSLNEAP